MHPDIRQARTLPTEYYTSATRYRQIIERVFVPSWQWIGDDRQVAAPGEVVPFTLLEGALDEPLLLSRDRQDRLHCLSNVCTHRGHIVCRHGGRTAKLRCAYHGRTFSLDGRMLHMPEFEGVEGFPSKQDNLPHLPLERWGPHLFTSLNPAVPFEELLQPMRDRLEWLPLQEFRFDPSRSRDYLVQANWALYCENYLEGFHIPYVHAGLNQAIDYGSYTTECYDWSSLQLGVASGGEQTFELPPSSPDHGQAIAAYYYWIWPNLMVNVYPWGLSLNLVKPLGVERTRVSFLAYVWREELLGVGAGAELDRVEREDEVVVEAVARGVRSRLYQGGRYSPSREQGVHHFHRLLFNAVEGGG